MIVSAGSPAECAARVGVGAVFDWLAEDPAGVFEQREQDIEPFVHRFRVAWEIDDERLAAGDGDPAESTANGVLQPFHGQQGWDTGDIALGDITCGLRGDISRAEARPARGDDDAGSAGITPRSELIGDGHPVIGQDAPGDDIVPGLAAASVDCGTTGVVPEADCPFIGGYEDRDLHHSTSVAGDFGEGAAARRGTELTAVTHGARK